MVLFTTSRWNTFVGGTYALPSALLVNIFLRLGFNDILVCFKF